MITVFVTGSDKEPIPLNISRASAGVVTNAFACPRCGEPYARRHQAAACECKRKEGGK